MKSHLPSFSTYYDDATFVSILQEKSDIPLQVEDIQEVLVGLSHPIPVGRDSYLDTFEGTIFPD